MYRFCLNEKTREDKIYKEIKKRRFNYIYPKISLNLEIQCWGEVKKPGTYLLEKKPTEEYIALNETYNNTEVKTWKCSSPQRQSPINILGDSCVFTHDVYSYIHIYFCVFFKAWDLLYILTHDLLFSLLLCCGGLTHMCVNHWICQVLCDCWIV